MKETKDLALTSLTFIISIGNMFFGAFVAMHLINWFFASYAGYQVGYWHAFGIKMTLNFLCTNKRIPKDDKEPSEKLVDSIVIFICYALFLLIGYAIS